MSTKRKVSDSFSEGSVETKKSRSNGRASPLVPIGERKMAKMGNPDPAMLRMLCLDTNSNERKELHYRKLDVDWNNKECIDKINAWRNQIYGRGGIKQKAILLWHKDEEAWIELYWQLLVKESFKVADIQLPKPNDVRITFNAFFKGKVLDSPYGGKLEPRADRESGPWASKMGRLSRPIKWYLESKMHLHGKRGETVTPVITQEMLVKYQKLKDDLVELGCSDKKIIPWAEVADGLNNKDYVVRCRDFFENLPVQEAQSNESDNEPDTESQNTVTTISMNSEFDNELLELATESPVQNKSGSEGEGDSENVVEHTSSYFADKSSPRTPTRGARYVDSEFRTPTPSVYRFDEETGSSTLNAQPSSSEAGTPAPEVRQFDDHVGFPSPGYQDKDSIIEVESPIPTAQSFLNWIRSSIPGAQTLDNTPSPRSQDPVNDVEPPSSDCDSIDIMFISTRGDLDAQTHIASRSSSNSSEGFMNWIGGLSPDSQAYFFRTPSPREGGAASIITVSEVSSSSDDDSEMFVRNETKEDRAVREELERYWADPARSRWNTDGIQYHPDFMNERWRHVPDEVSAAIEAARREAARETAAVEAAEAAHEAAVAEASERHLAWVESQRSAGLPTDRSMSLP